MGARTRLLLERFLKQEARDRAVELQALQESHYQRSTSQLGRIEGRTVYTAPKKPSERPVTAQPRSAGQESVGEGCWHTRPRYIE